MKLCKSCNLITSDFGKNKARKDGLSFYCRPCNRKLEQISISKLSNKKNKQVVVSFEKNCQNCNWNFGGKCVVKNPGQITEIENDNICHKFERFVEREIDIAELHS
jgi:hypothetical protein